MEQGLGATYTNSIQDFKRCRYVVMEENVILIGRSNRAQDSIHFEGSIGH